MKKPRPKGPVLSYIHICEELTDRPIQAERLAGVNGASEASGGPFAVVLFWRRWPVASGAVLGS